MPSLAESRPRFAIILAGLMLVFVQSALAGGFSISEQGVRSMGMGGAFLYDENDPAGIFDNVASIAFVRHPSFMLGGHVGWTRVTLAGQDAFPGAAAEESWANTLRLKPVASYVQPLGARLTVGVGVRTPFHHAASWSDPETFSGRFIAQEARIISREITPTVGYRLADRLAIGAGIGIHYASLDLHRSLPAVNPFDFTVVDVAALHAGSDTASAVSCRAGLVAEFANGVALTFAYDSRAQIEIEGAGAITRLQTANAELDNRMALLMPAASVPFQSVLRLPAQIGGTLSYRGDDWGAVADVRLQRWSALQELSLVFAESQPPSSEPPAFDAKLLQGFENVLQLRFGVERQVRTEWKLRAGFAYDPTPAPIDSISPAFTDANRYCATIGATWSRQNLRIDMAQAIQFFAERRTEGMNPEGYDGSYKSFRAILGLSLGYRF
ncbi:MAG: outer membrane protein transport protein [Vicinamibacteria bacterium]|nr:outer membrane protein transport protein [Vicinamibacteria bacterium]